MNTRNRRQDDTPAPFPRRLALVALGVLALVLWLTFTDADTAEEPTEPQQQSDDVPAEVLSGVVVDDANRPVEGASVTVNGREATTDYAGSFSFDEIDTGTHLVDVEADDYIRPGVGDESLALVTIEDEPVKDLELTLQQPASISGRVTAGGEPVEGAEVGLWYLEAAGLDGTSLDPFVVSEADTSGEGGDFLIEAVAPGRLEVVVDTDDAFAQSEPVRLTPGDELDGVTIDLEPTGSIEGEVVGDPGAGVDGQGSLTAHYADEPGEEFEIEDGQFLLERLEPGQYELTVDAPGHHLKTIEDVLVPPDDPTSVDVQLEPSRGLVGLVVEPDGTPVADASVTVEHSDDEQMRRLETDEEGRFQWAEADRGEYTAVANSPHHDPSAPTTLKPDEEVAVQLQPGGHITGRVLDENRRPVDEFSVGVSFLEIHGEDHHHVRELPAEAFDDRRGRFEVGPVPTGRYQLTVDVDSRPGAVSQPVEVTAGERVGPVTVQLDASATVEGFITDADGSAPISGAQIVLDDPASQNNPSAQTDADGFYRLDDLPSGVQRLRVEADGYVTEIFDAVDLPADGILEYDVEMIPATGGRDGFARHDIGAAFGMNDGDVEVMAIRPGTPAEDSELEVGDIVEAVDGQQTDEMSVDEVLQRIRGDRPEPVTLQVHRRGRGSLTIDVDRRREFTAQGGGG